MTLELKGLEVTVVATRSISKTEHKVSSSSIALERTSDGYDKGGIAQAESINLDRFRHVDLVEKMNGLGCPVDCIVYQSFLPWALDAAKKFGLVGAVFLTQSCAVDSIYYHAQQGLLKLPLIVNEVYSLTNLPPYEPRDMPSFIYDKEGYPGAFVLVVKSQFSHISQGRLRLGSRQHFL